MGFFRWLFPKVEVPPPAARSLSRNDPCWCGTGDKYKTCHLERDRDYFAREDAAREAACRLPG